MRRFTGVVSALCVATTLTAGMPFISNVPVVHAEEGEFNQITNDTFFKDKDGNFLYSQGGGIFEFDGKYYWYGVKYEEAVNYATNRTPSSENHFAGITCYSSTDLVNWTDEGIIAGPEDVYNESIMKGNPAAWVGRLGVTKLSDGTYALLVQHECSDEDNSIDNANRGNTGEETDGWSKQVLIMTADAPNGHFTWNNRINMKSYIGTTNTGDQTVFVDPATGKGYLLYSYGKGRGKMYLSQVVKGDDGIVTLSESRMIYSGSGREGNCMFEYNGKYYVCASDLYGWNASHGYYLVLDSLDDEYLKTRPVTKSMYVMDGASDDYCHVSQTGFFYTVRGSKQDTVIFCGDRWSDFADNGDGFNVWCPLSFDENGIPYFNSVSSWKLNEATGEWKVSKDNNYIKNGSFDADRITVTDFVGWKEEILSGEGSITNTNDCVTGKYALSMTGAGSFEEQISQTITSSKDMKLDDGLYDFTCKIKNTEGFEDITLFAKSSDMSYGYTIAGANDEYTEVKLDNVVVKDGKAEIGIYAKGTNARLAADDLTFVKSDVTDYATGSLTGKLSGDEKTVGKTVTIKATNETGKSFSKDVVIGQEATEYELSHLPEGTYALSVQGDGVAIKMDAASTKDNRICDIKASNMTGDVTGRVVTNTGDALSGVKVVLSGNDTELETVTDENGNYSFSGVNQGSYNLSYSLTGYAVADSSANTLVAAGETTVKADTLMGKERGGLKGTLVATDGSAISNARVIAKLSDGSSTNRYTATTGEDGSFDFGSLPGGDFTILATTTPDNQYTSVPTTAGKISVSDSSIINVTLRMPEDKTASIENPTFDGKNMNGWSNGADSAGYRNGKKQSHGTYDLAPWASNDFRVDTYQTITGLADGYYVVSAMAQTEYTSNDTIYLYAKDADGNTLATDVIPSGDSAYELTTVKAKVSGGTLTIGIAGHMSGGKWANIDDFHLGYLGDDISTSQESLAPESGDMNPDYVPTTPSSPESIEEVVLVGTSTAKVTKTKSEDNDKKDGESAEGTKGNTDSSSNSGNSGNSSSSSSTSGSTSTNAATNSQVKTQENSVTVPAAQVPQVAARVADNSTARNNKKVTESVADATEDEADDISEDTIDDNTIDNSIESAANTEVEDVDDSTNISDEEVAATGDKSKNAARVLEIIMLAVVVLAAGGFGVYKLKRR